MVEVVLVEDRVLEVALCDHIADSETCVLLIRGLSLVSLENLVLSSYPGEFVKSAVALRR